MTRPPRRTLGSEAEDSYSAADLSREQVEAQLQKILGSALFRKAPRHSSFLKFVVNKSLAGEAESVKEYLIGVEVFDRQSGYDPGSDPIVRAEARRLRSRLTEYYSELGQHDPVRIELPKGTYVPVFERNGSGFQVATDEELDNEPVASEQRESEALQQVQPAEVAEVSRRHRRNFIGGSILVLLAVLAVTAYGIRHHFAKNTFPAISGEAAANNVLVLAEFTNTTGDAIFDRSLRQSLSSELEQSPFFDILPDQRIAQTLSLMSQPKDTWLTRELAREVCQRTAGMATVEGSIARAGDQYALQLEAVNCRTGQRLANEQMSVADKQDVQKGLAQATARLRQTLGESLASIGRYDAAPESATTGSLEALQAYSLGTYAMMVSGDYDAAIPLFQRATNLDPNFAMAYARLGTSYSNVNQNERAAENLRGAYALRERVSDRERFYIDSHYYQLVTGDMVAARATYELWGQTYPSDEVPAINLGRTYAELGDYDKSLASYQKALQLDPGSALLYGNLVFAYLSVNRLDEARAMAQQAEARKLNSSATNLYLYWVDFLQHDTAGMAHQVSSLTGKPGYEDLALYMEANTASYTGQLVKARKLTRQAAESATKADDKATAAGYQAIHAVHEALVGNAEMAKQQAESALALSPSQEVQSIAGLALALAGDSQQSSRLANELAKRYPEDTWVQFLDVPTIRAADALERGNGEKAIAALAPSAPYEMGRGDLIWMYPVYLRAQAYLAAGQSTAAIAEFRTILDHPGITLNEPIGALSYLGLGRAYAKAGDTAKATTAYQDFLALWKAADTDVPVLRQARLEYARLTQH